MLRHSIPSTIEIHESIDLNCYSILADPTQLHQILMNLCTNAFHAMEHTGGSMIISLENHDIDLRLKTSQIFALLLLGFDINQLIIHRYLGD